MATLPNIFVKNDMGLISGGYPGEAIGIDEGTYAEWTPCPDSGTAVSYYYYTDSNVPNNENSSRVTFKITDDWNASVDGSGNLTVRVRTTVNSIVRGNIRGNPNLGSTATRGIDIKRDAGSSPVWSVRNNSIATAATLATNITVSEYTFTIAPGRELSRGTLYIKNFVTGHEGDPVPSQYIDELWGGVAFKNSTPPDYRPGATWDGSTWQSHNRSNGACHMYNGSNYIEMRTANGAVGTDNPPYIRHSDNYKNQRKVGANG